MKRKIALKHLAQAERMVALSLKHIADQELRIKRLSGDELDQAQDLLKTFKQGHVLHEEHRNRLLRELGA